MEEDEVFGWSNSYRAFLLLILLVPFVDIFIQLALENWAWTAVSVIFSVVILGMLLFSYRRPFIRLANGELRFYLLPIPPIVFQRVKLGEITGYWIENSKLVIDLVSGKKARANLYAVKAADREKLINLIMGTDHHLS
jgi:hypothetical protein